MVMYVGLLIQVVDQFCHGDVLIQAADQFCHGDVLIQAADQFCHGDVLIQAVDQYCHGAVLVQQAVGQLQLGIWKALFFFFYTLFITRYKYTVLPTIRNFS